MRTSTILALFAFSCVLTPKVFAQQAVEENTIVDNGDEMIQLENEEADINVIDEQPPGVPESNPFEDDGMIPLENEEADFNTVDEAEEAVPEAFEEDNQEDANTETGVEVTIPPVNNGNLPTTGTVVINTSALNANVLGMSGALVLSAIAVNMMV